MYACMNVIGYRLCICCVQPKIFHGRDSATCEAVRWLDEASGANSIFVTVGF